MCSPAISPSHHSTAHFFVPKQHLDDSRVAPYPNGVRFLALTSDTTTTPLGERRNRGLEGAAKERTEGSRLDYEKSRQERTFCFS
ncbi:hypothetical protein AOLI_G00316630 [Acnodon oligacanthus]